MENISELIKTLYSSDNKLAYQALQALADVSTNTNKVYRYFDEFVEMIKNSNSYLRTRGLVLIAANAKWDEDNKIDEIIDEYLNHITDEKPITARQCIKLLPTIAKFKPDLSADIKIALSTARITKYSNSMGPLILKDISNALKKIS
ncbi:MAG TPA: SufBD protein [Caproicibacter sp.]|nr:SufBD protein [Caproicibacter sp.]